MINGDIGPGLFFFPFYAFQQLAVDVFSPMFWPGGYMYKNVAETPK
jgi:hypothetical protein